MIVYFLVISMYYKSGLTTIPRYYETKEACIQAANEVKLQLETPDYRYACVPWNSEGD